MTEEDNSTTLNFQIYDETWSKDPDQPPGYYVGMEDDDEVFGPFETVEEARNAIVEWMREYVTTMGGNPDDKEQFSFVEEDANEEKSA